MPSKRKDPEEAEKCLIGSILTNPKKYLQTCLDAGLNAEAFMPNRPAHVIFQAMMELHGRKKSVDIISIVDALEANGSLARAGGSAGVDEVLQFVPTGANYEVYLDIVLKDAAIRVAKFEMEEIQTSLSTVRYREDVLEVLANTFKRSISYVTPKATGDTDRSLLLSYVNSVEERAKGTRETVFSTPLETLNARAGGTGAGEVLGITGVPSCLDGESRIRFLTKKKGVRPDSKGGTIKRLWHRFHKIPQKGKGGGIHKKSQGRDFYVMSANLETNEFFANKILDVVASGKKECIKIKLADGKEVVCTTEHKILTPTGFVKAGDLLVGSEVNIYSSKRERNRKAKVNRYPEYFVKYHPAKKWKNVGGYNYCRIRICRAVLESQLNGMTLAEYRRFLNTASCDEIDKLKTIPSKMHVHHINENHLDDRPENLCVVSPSDHGKLHYADHMKNFRPKVQSSIVASIDGVGERETYDIMCEFPHNNFVAGDIVVHNSGKSILGKQFALHNLLTHGMPTMVITGEMPYQQWMDRAVCEIGQIDFRNFRMGRLTEHEQSSLVRTISRISKLPLYVYDRKRLRMERPMVESAIRAEAKSHGIKCVLLDYLQLIKSPNGKKDQRTDQEIGEVSNMLKDVSVTFGLHTIALCAENDEGQVRNSREPEYDFDNILKLIVKTEKNPKTGNPMIITDKVLVTKWRDSERGYTIRVEMVGKHCMFKDITGPNA